MPMETMMQHSIIDHGSLVFILAVFTWLIWFFAILGVLAVYEGSWSPLGVYAFAVFVWIQAVGISWGSSVLLTWARRRD